MANPEWTDPIDWEDHGIATISGVQFDGILVSRFTSDDGTKWIVADLEDGRRVQIEPDKWAVCDD